MSHESREAQAIVLDGFNHGESDKIVTFFTSEHGRFTGIAKGANRSKKRFLNKLELFTRLTITYKENRNSTLILILDGDLHDSYFDIRTDIQKYSAATFIREIVLLTTLERERDDEIFLLLRWALYTLSHTKDHLKTTTLFLLKMYDRLGYRPDFSMCKFCNQPFSLKTTYSFHALSGGLVCSKCKRETENTIDLPAGTIRLLDTALRTPLEKLHRLRFSDHSLRQSLHILHNYGKLLLQRDIQSWKSITSFLM